MDNEREAFDAWHKNELPDVRLDKMNGTYTRSDVHFRWEGWQARAAQETTANQIEYVKMRLAQIASGDYRVCGLSAEDVAKDALTALSGDNIVE